MVDLDNLRPEVRSALGAIVRADVCRDSVPTDAFDTIRAELLRLAKENADLLSTIDLDEQVWVQHDETMHRWIERARNAEAELAALRKRVDNAPTGTLLVNYSHGQPISANVAADDGEALAAIDQCSVRLVVDDD